MTFGERLREARKKNGLTQKELAAKIGAKHNSVSNWEKGKVMPYPDVIGYICGALGVDANYFFSDGADEQAETDTERFCRMYDALDDHGKAVVDAVLQLEVDRIQEAAR